MRLPLIPTSPGEQIWICDFCGKNQHEVSGIVVGPRDVAICNCCVKRCGDVLAPKPATAPTVAEPTEQEA